MNAHIGTELYFLFSSPEFTFLYFLSYVISLCPMSKVLKDSAPMCIVRDIIIGGSQLVVHMFCRQVQQNQIL